MGAQVSDRQGQLELYKIACRITECVQQICQDHWRRRPPLCAESRFRFMLKLNLRWKIHTFLARNHLVPRH